MARYYISDNGVVDVVTFWAGVNTKKRAGRTKGASTPRKQEANFRGAARTLARLIHCNFAHGDMLITLKYEQMPEGDRRDWIKQRNLFLDRMRRALKKRGEELRYLAVTSDMDGETGKAVRPHHHIIMQRADYDLVCALWPFGSVDYQVLRDQRDYTPLAVYMLRQVRHQPDAKKYTPSKNLRRPRVVEVDLEPGEVVEVPRGAEKLDEDYDINRPCQYLRYAVAVGKKPRVRRGRRRNGGDKHADQHG